MTSINFHILSDRTRLDYSGRYVFWFCPTNFRYYQISAAQNKLRTMFKSIKFCPSYNLHFYFEDVDDEAFFQLYLNETLEI